MKTSMLITTILSVAFSLTACGGKDKPMDAIMPVKYSVTVTNLSAGQPFSPPALIMHEPGYHAFAVGVSASLGLEKLAEGGDTVTLLSEADENPMTLASGKGASGVAPGKSLTLSTEAMVMESQVNQLMLTLVSMAGNTNDGFTGINSVNVGKMMVGERMTINTVAYDSGTEKNTESAATVPGPAAGGEGFNAARDDNPGFVAMHPGVISTDDDLPTSALSNMQRWDNPIARVTITRLQ